MVKGMVLDSYPAKISWYIEETGSEMYFGGRAL